jgi:hypothetical protein
VSSLGLCGLVLATFLLPLPLTSVQCRGQVVMAPTGMDLSFSRNIGGQFAAHPPTAVSVGWLFVTGILPVVGLLITVADRRDDSRLPDVVRCAIGCVGTALVLVVVWVIVNANDSLIVQQLHCEVQPAVGFWLSAGPFAIMCALGLVAWRPRWTDTSSAEAPAEGEKPAGSDVDGSAIDEQHVERSLAVALGGQGVDAGGLQAGVAHQLGDRDQVDAGTDQLRAEGVAENVGRERLQ